MVRLLHAEGPLRWGEIVSLTGSSPSMVSVDLRWLEKHRQVRHTDWGTWEAVREFPQDTPEFWVNWYHHGFGTTIRAANAKEAIRAFFQGGKIKLQVGGEGDQKPTIYEVTIQLDVSKSES